MQLYTYYAEQLLVDKSKAISAQASRWRCIYLNFSEHSDRPRNHVVTNIFKELFKGEDGNIYLCKNGDVFLLFTGKVGGVVEKLEGQFRDINYQLFDLGLQWAPFFELCESKLTALQSQGPAEASPVPAPKPLREINAEIFRDAKLKRAGRPRLQVLVVEDDPFTRRLVHGTLKGEYEVIEAADGEEAIAAYEAFAPDAVFLDIELPDTNGHEILSQLLAFDPSAFVVMLSANSVKENILTALEKGAQGFATKPFAREKLIHYLRLCETLRRGRAIPTNGALHA